jgi:hypothetical protein
MLADATQTRPDFQHPSSRSEVVFSVQTRQHGRSDELAAQGLWFACQGSTLGRRLLPPGLESLGDGRFRAVVRPALGTHARTRLRGCIEDVTVDRVKGHLLSVRRLPAAG